jgi:hypothetical protein
MCIIAFYELSTGCHRYAFFRAGLGAKAASVTVGSIQEQFAILHCPALEIANIDAIPAEIADIEIGVLDIEALVALVFIGVCEVTATIIAAKADTIGDQPVGFIAERPGHQAFLGDLVEKGQHVGKPDFFNSAAAGLEIAAEHQANIDTRSAAMAASLATSAIRNPKPMMLKC